MSATFKIARSAFVSGALILSAFAPAAFAEGKDGSPSFRVRYGDIDMSRPAGGAKLLARIEHAARRACDTAIPNSPLFAGKETKCRRETVAATVNRLEFPTLIAAWSGKYPAVVMAAR